MLSPFLVIGLGGSGGKTVRALRESLALELEQRGWSGRLPDAWQFLHIDSPATQNGADFPAAMLPPGNYLSLVPTTLRYPQIYDSALGQIESQARSSFEAVLPAPYRGDVNMPRPIQRGFGRTISVASLGRIHSRIEVAVDTMCSPEVVAELSGLGAAIGQPPQVGAQQPTVYVVSSLVGLTGSGILLDVIQATKSAIGTMHWANQVFSILFAPDVFEELGPNMMGTMAPNALGAMAELVSAGLRGRHNESSSALFRSHGLIPTAEIFGFGPSINYIVGRGRRQEKRNSESSAHSIFMLAQALTARMIDPKIDEYIRVHAAYSPSRYPEYRDKSGLTTPLFPNSFSTLGFSRVSLGLDRFRTYATRRIAKEAIETILWKHISDDPELQVRTSKEWVDFRSDAYEAEFIHLLDLTTISNSDANQVTQYSIAMRRELIEKISHVVLEQGLQVSISLISRLIERVRESQPALVENYLESIKAALRASLASFDGFIEHHGAPHKSEANFWAGSNYGTDWSRYLPSANEQTLLELEDFPRLFDDLIRSSVGLRSTSPIAAVVTEIILDALGDPVDSKSRADSFILSPDLILDNTRQWLRTPGSPFENFLSEGIEDYLAASGDEIASEARTSRFVSAMIAAIQDADPCVSLDKNLLSLTQGSVDRRAVCSGIPIEPSHKSYEIISDAIVAGGYNDSRQWFKSPASGARSQSVEIFTTLDSPVSPLVINALLGPIASEWISASGNYASRSNFMNWRRGRELPEAIPAHEDRWNAMLRGWHVARLLNMFENDTKHESYADKGPKVSIWTDPAKGWKMFPYPLHSIQIAKNVDDYPAVMLESLIIALVNCYSSRSLEPLAPYLRLMELGGGNQNQWPDLENWILNGNAKQGAPPPRPERAGGASDAPNIRKKVSITYVTEMSDRFEQRMAALDPRDDPRTYPGIWEIRDAMRASFADLLSALRNIEASEL